MPLHGGLAGTGTAMGNGGWSHLGNRGPVVQLALGAAKLSEDGVGTLLSVNRLKEVVFHQFGPSVRQHEVGSG